MVAGPALPTAGGCRYEKLKAQLLEVRIDRAPLLEMLIQRIFDKVPPIPQGPRWPRHILAAARSLKGWWGCGGRCMENLRWGGCKSRQHNDSTCPTINGRGCGCSAAAAFGCCCCCCCCFQVVEEAHFAEIYARLCADLDSEASKLKKWQYVYVVRDAADDSYFWVADLSSTPDDELIPCGSEAAACDLCAAVGAGTLEPQMVAAPLGAALQSLVKHGGRLVKVWTVGGALFTSFGAWSEVEEMVKANHAGGPYRDTTKGGTVLLGAVEAEKKGAKATALKRLLLNKCQEAFETDDIYAEIERKFAEGDPAKMTAVERAQRIEDRDLATLKVAPPPPPDDEVGTRVVPTAALFSTCPQKAPPKALTGAPLSLPVFSS